jgi:uncharacterized membrane protein YqaE (UPF0057 family)
MKRLLFALIIIFTITSCSDRFSLIKRRYTKGFYVSVKKAPVKPSHVNAERTPAPVVSEPVATQRVTGEVAKPVEPIRSEQKTMFPLQSPVKPKQHTKTPSLEANANPHQPEISDVQLNWVPLSELAPKSDVDSDVMFVLLVILAILLPPLAVYLKNMKADTWFWVTLILWLCWFLFFFSHVLGIFWLAAAVIALLYVFEVIK